MKEALQGVKEAVIEVLLFFVSVVAGLFSLGWSIVVLVLAYGVAVVFSFLSLLIPRVRGWWNAQIGKAQAKKTLVNSLLDAMDQDKKNNT